MWYIHLFNLFMRSWQALMSSTSTNTLGFVLWTILVAIITYFASVFAASVKLREKGIVSPFRQAFADSLLTGVFSLIGVSLLVLSAWVAFIVPTVYKDHQSLAGRNLELLGKGNGNPHVIFGNNQFASTVNTFQAFAILENGDNTIPNTNNPCHLLITSPEENRNVGQILGSLAAASHCFVESPNPLTPLPSPPSDIVLIHISPKRKNGPAFATALSNALEVKISPDEPQEPKGAVWIQIGKGNVWRKAN